ASGAATGRGGQLQLVGRLGPGDPSDHRSGPRGATAPRTSRSAIADQGSGAALAFFATAVGWPLCPATTWTSSHPTWPLSRTPGLRAPTPSRSCEAITWASSGSIPNSWAILLVGEVEPHEVRAQGPDPQRLVVAGESRPGQVVEPRAA